MKAFCYITLKYVRTAKKVKEPEQEHAFEMHLLPKKSPCKYGEVHFHSSVRRVAKRVLLLLRVRTLPSVYPY